MQIVENISEIIRDTLRKRGYKEIIVPTMGDLSLWKENNIVKIIDGKGRVVALRPEITSLVIQKVSYYGEPLRLYYMGPIFSYINGEIQERYQIGWELIEENKISRDFEAIYLIYEIFSKLNIKEFIIEINSTKIWNYLYSKEKEENMEKLRKFALKRDYVSLIEESLNKELMKSLVYYPRSVIKDNDINTVLEELKSFKDELIKGGIDNEKISISPILLRPYEYYDGIIFQVYISNLKKAIGGGGSYIKYNEKGEKISGIGFAFIEDNLREIYK
ncbi:MAG: ATP phosphoribosyltransferase regulatory subunit [Dictyoglomus sp. NZ13-RE01]|nr:MAG: ATP phosphoribosyltransferase regulatory subunit [Dictyoglomus sp. NZ13-RE01]